ncbi:MAG: hypothetical protein H6834_05170 [Planctomycetes bacterium]|nr:hypothetical protein [Planctomycetota bacterium]
MEPLDIGSFRLFPGHLRIFSGTVCAGFLEETPGGIHDLIAPPYAAVGLNVRFHVRDERSGECAYDREPRTPGHRQLMVQQRGSWRLDRLERVSLYHQRLGTRQLAFQLRQTVIALSDRPGLLVRFERRDLDGPERDLSIVPEVSIEGLRRLEPGEWTWFRPQFTNHVQRHAPWMFEGDGVWLRLRANTLARDGAFAMDGPRIDVLIEFSPTPPPADERPVTDEEITTCLRVADRTFAERERWLEETFPHFTSDDPDLDRFYERSKLGALCCRWDHPDFVTRPFFTSEGMDGGGICSYVWDLSYLSRMTPWMFGRDLSRAMLARFEAMDPSAHFAFDPFDGRGFGPPYALNAYSLARLLREHVAWHQDFSLLTNPGPSGSWLDVLERLVDAGKASALDPLLDYGDTTNLLELRTGGYEHVVPSPNAERAWILRFLASMRERLGLPRAEGLRERAAAIERALERHLWDAAAGWFLCSSADGSMRETVYSVQVLTLLGLEDLPTTFRDGLLAELRDGAFLGTHGLHSIALHDERHWESFDVDWGGGGTYVGQAPVLVLDLYRMGRADLAETLLSRLLWWGRIYPHFPQSIRADREAYCDFDRANCIAGLAGVQAIVHGLCGIEATMDGRLCVQPHAYRGGGFQLRDFPWRGGRVDIRCDGRRFHATCDGASLAEGDVRGSG